MSGDQTRTIWSGVNCLRDLNEIKCGRSVIRLLVVTIYHKLSYYLNCIVVREYILACANESTSSNSSLPQIKHA
jgi:hypothetical protein